MTETDDVAELLFFDTFSHEVDADINLDLVQFPKPVYITQVRIIPLGARVQADFPGGVRLGATNPSKFGIEFFVNDLGMPGASTFENLGHLEYNQNDCIHLECTLEKIPTDGLVLRGWYSTITLAVYGIFTNTVAEQIASPPLPPQPLEPSAPEELCAVSSSVGGNVSSETVAVLPEEPLKEAWKEPLPGDAPHVHKNNLGEYVERDDMEYAMSSREAAAFHHSEDERERRLRKASHSSDRSVTSRNRTHSESNERDYLRARSDRDRERGGEKPSRDWSRSPEYAHRSRRKRSERSRSDAEEAAHKWPRTPPASIESPLRPRSPDGIEYCDNGDIIGSSGHYKIKSRPYLRSSETLVSHISTTTHDLAMTNDDDETPGTPGEQFEPILSDDEIMGDDDESNEPNVAVDEFELELETEACSAAPAIKEFDPFTMRIQQFKGDSNAFYIKELETLLLIFNKFEMQSKCSSLELYKAGATSVDERENFVFLSEQLINQLTFLSQNYMRRNFVLKQFLMQNEKNSERAFNILKIAVDFEAACLQPQPAFKIRHIKIGARLTELLGSCNEFVDYMLHKQQFEPFASLFSLYQQEFMAMSIKLMLLKAIYALLDTKSGLTCFLSSKINGYQWILQNIQQTPLTRTKYALKSIVKKLNLNESLECIRENCTKLFVLSNFNAPADSLKLVELSISELLEALTGNVLSYQQPRRFLPVSKKFEVVADNNAQRCYFNALQGYFKSQSLGECLLLLLSNASELPATLLMNTLNLLQALMQTQVGIDYLADDCFETTQTLVAVLLGIEDLPVVEEEIDTKPKSLAVALDEKPLKAEIKTESGTSDKTMPIAAASTEATAKLSIPILMEDASKVEQNIGKLLQDMQMPLRKPILHRLQKIGIELAYKMQTRYHLDVLLNTATACNASGEYDAIKLATHLHALYSQTCSSPGRQHTIYVIGSNNHLQIFMDLIKREQRLQSQRQLVAPSAKYKSPVLSYAVDLLDCCVRYSENLEYLIEHGTKILDLAKNHDIFDSSVSAVLQELFVYLRPLEANNIFSYDDISPLVEVITRSIDYITTFPGDLIIGLRILRHLVIGKSICSNNTKTTSGAIADTEELRHRFVALQFYAVDGVQTLIQILEKLSSFFDQPGLHAPALMTNHGIYCCQIILPTLQILRAILSFAIQCRDVAFKDVTAIDHLMKTYFLMHYFPAGSAALEDAELAKKEIIQILLSYTQPNEQDEEFLHKSLWTQMVREVLKNILHGPSTYIPGLQVLAELLPLPLPLPTTVQLQEDQTQRLITERKLWSAHLHPQSSQLAKLIETIAPTSFPQLADLLTRVCLQLADLAPNMTLLISKTIADLLWAEWSASNTATPHLARLLHFFAQLTPFASVKSSALSILSGKLWELLQAILLSTELTACTLKCQLSVHRIFESFLDSEISLMSPQCTSSAEVNLASALPPKELLPRITEAILVNIFHVEMTHDVAALAARNLVILTEHDITYYHLMQQLKQKLADFQLWLVKLISSTETRSYNAIIETVVLLLRSLIQIEEDSATFDSSIPTRTLKLTPNELSQLLVYQKDSEPSNLLQRLSAALTSFEADITNSLLADMNNLSTYLQTIETTPVVESDEDSLPPVEPLLPQTEGIVTQFAARPIFTVYETSADETQLCTQFWLDPLRLDNMTQHDFEMQCERITCDLIELGNSCLTVDTNLSSDCKRLLHLSASPQSNRERTPTAPCFRTRRVEVEPSTGRPEKKIYITPSRGRGFSRAPPSRGDLFRSRPPNTSRPPSLHVDDFLALETCGAQPTGPTGYNKIPTLMRGSRVGRNRGSRISAASSYRKPKPMRTSSPSTWNDSGSQHYRSATTEPVNSHFGDSHYASGSSSHFSGRPRGRGGRQRSYLR